MDNNILKTVIPSAMFIEIARDGMKSGTDPDRREKKLKELYEAVGEASEDFKNGFLLGLKTGEVVLTLEPELSLNKE